VRKGTLLGCVAPSNRTIVKISKDARRFTTLDEFSLPRTVCCRSSRRPILTIGTDPMEIAAVTRSSFGIVGECVSVKIVKKIVGTLWCKFAEFKVCQIYIMRHLL
jgi:hypothetical protein